MDRPKTLIRTARDILSSAEAFDLRYTGGLFLQETDVDHYIDRLLGEIARYFGADIEIARYEPLVNAVKIEILPVEQAHGFYVFCRSKWDFVESVQQDDDTNVFVITFKIRPPVRFMSSVVSILFYCTITLICHYMLSVVAPNFSIESLWRA